MRGVVLAAGLGRRKEEDHPWPVLPLGEEMVLRRTLRNAPGSRLDEVDLVPGEEGREVLRIMTLPGPQSTAGTTDPVEGRDWEMA